MKKRRWLQIHLVLLVSLSLMVGCSALQKLKRSSGTSAKPAQGNLYNQVPAAMRAPVKEASFDLKEAQADLKLADAKVVLADLRKERSILEKKQADSSKKLAEILVKKAEMVIERKRLEAIDNANLGDKAANIKQVANLRTKELSIESDAVNTRAEIATMDLEIKTLDKKIAAQAQKVSKLK